MPNSHRRTAVLILRPAVLLLAGTLLVPACTATPPESVDPTFEERLAAASVDPVLVERGDQGEVMVVTGRIPVPGSVPADPESRADWFLDEYGEEIGIDDVEADTEVRDIVEAEAGTPEEGDAIVTYDRTADGVPVLGGEVKVEVSGDGEITVLISRIPGDLADVPTMPAITEAQATARALMAHPGATARSATLMITNEGFYLGTDTPSRLVWRISLEQGRLNAPVRFVDAITGELLDLQDTNVVEARHRFTWTSRGMCGNPELVLDESGPVAGAVATTDATTGHAQARTVWDWFWSTFRRDSHDGRGADMVTVTDVPQENAAGMCWALPNAFWDKDQNAMFFGDRTVVLDVFGHEYSHGLVAKTAKLPYQGQSGALDESFADAFGAFIDSGSRWTIGDGSPLGRPGDMGVIRDMANPHRFCQPEHMDEYVNAYPRPPAGRCMSDVDCSDTTVALPGGCSLPVLFTCNPDSSTCRISSNDFGGVHINSGIPNHALYLAAVGGEGPRDRIRVEPIGIEKAQQIWFRALTWYMVSSGNFVYAKIALRLAALKFARTHMHGVMYEDCGSVLTAYGAVGVGAIDFDRDCFTDPVDNCPTIHNPAQQPVDCLNCANRTMCEGCTLTDGCAWCRDADNERCVHADRTEGCMDLVTERDMCVDSCSNRGGPCGGSGPTFDGDCCAGLVCVVGDCQTSPCNRERTACADASECCLGLACRAVGSAGASPQCCVRADGYCEAKEDCCGLMDCTGNRCQGRTTGEVCLFGDCVGTSYCDAGTCA